MSVFETFGLQCPNCGRDDRLRVTISAFAMLLPNGAEACGDYEWENTSPCRCLTCDHSGTVSDFEIEPKKVEP